MAESSVQLTYDEPTIMWRMRRGDRLRAHAVIGPQGDGASVMWFLNNRLIGVRNFRDWSCAIRWSDQMRRQNWTAGWRLAPDSDVPGQT